MVNPRAELFQFILEKSEYEPTPKRVRLLRALAEYAGSEKATAELRSLADCLEAADALSQEFTFSLMRDEHKGNGHGAKGESK